MQTFEFWVPCNQIGQREWARGYVEARLAGGGAWIFCARQIVLRLKGMTITSQGDSRLVQTTPPTASVCLAVLALTILLLL